MEHDFIKPILELNLRVGIVKPGKNADYPIGVRINSPPAA